MGCILNVVDRNDLQPKKPVKTDPYYASLFLYEWGLNLISFRASVGCELGSPIDWRSEGASDYGSINFYVSNVNKSLGYENLSWAKGDPCSVVRLRFCILARLIDPAGAVFWHKKIEMLIPFS